MAALVFMAKYVLPMHVELTNFNGMIHVINIFLKKLLGIQITH